MVKVGVVWFFWGGSGRCFFMRAIRELPLRVIWGIDVLRWERLCTAGMSFDKGKPGGQGRHCSIPTNKVIFCEGDYR